VFSQGLQIREASVTPQAMTVIDTVFLASTSGKLPHRTDKNTSTRRDAYNRRLFAFYNVAVAFYNVNPI
jgi:hypothetical protein